MWNENIGQGRTSYVLLKSMKAILILMKESAISLRAAEPDANCFWIPLQYWTTQVNIIKLKKGPKFLSNNDAKYISHLDLQILLEIIYYIIFIMSWHGELLGHPWKNFPPLMRITSLGLTFLHVLLRFSVLGFMHVTHMTTYLSKNW